MLLVGLLLGAYGGVLFAGFFLLGAPPSDLEFFYIFWETVTSSIGSFITVFVPVILFALVGFLASYVFVQASSLRQASATFHSVTEADRSKDEFISMVLHHIRTPLAGIKWSLSEMSKNDTFPAEAKSDIAILLTENNRALSAV